MIKILRVSRFSSALAGVLLSLVAVIGCVSCGGYAEVPEFYDVDRAVLDRKACFARRQERIDKLRVLLDDMQMADGLRYLVNGKLYDEYRKFDIDSARYFARCNMEIAGRTGDRDGKAYWTMCQVPLEIYSGQLLRASELMREISVASLPDSLKVTYYRLCGSYSYKYRMKNADGHVSHYRTLYLDSILRYAAPGSWDYNHAKFCRYAESGDHASARDMILELMSEEPDSTEIYASMACTLAWSFRALGDEEQARRYFARSAIADMRSAIRENSSMQVMAKIAYDIGDLNHATKYTNVALEDALECNANFRVMEVARFNREVNAAFQQRLAEKQSDLKAALVIGAVLLLMVAGLLIYIYRQMMVVSRTKQELVDANAGLSRLNSALAQRNEALADANSLREGYIMQFIELCSIYIDKMEGYRRSLNSLALKKRIDDLCRSLKSTAVLDHELEELYIRFDSIFLNLYPTFVNDFNELLVEEERIHLGSAERLNKELRIYALLRLGITDSSRMAAFLHCSLSTVYNYRTKMRNKAAVPRDEFEPMVMKIGRGRHVHGDNQPE